MECHKAIHFLCGNYTLISKSEYYLLTVELALVKHNCWEVGMINGIRITLTLDSNTGVVRVTHT